MDLKKYIVHKHPELEKKLLMAKINKKPEVFIGEVIKKTIMSSLTIMVLIFIFFSKNPNFIIIFLVSVPISIKFLLIKLNSGQPLVNAIFDASKSFGVANKYFKEIVRDIELGTPLEEALDNAAKYSASKRFKKILFNINNAIKIGIDVSKSLNSILDEIAEEQLIEIQRYGKKLNSFTMFYMLIAIIMPSLGMTMAVVIISMLPNMGSLANFLFWIFGISLIIIQFIFITMFKGARPNVNI